MLRLPLRTAGRRLLLATVWSLVKLGIVLAIIAAFAVGTVVIPRIDTGQGKTLVVHGVVVPTAKERSTGYVRAVISLFQGRLRRVTDDDTPVDIVEPDPMARIPFSLEAGEDDGPRFFVHAFAEVATYERFCADVPLPRLRVVERDGERSWVVARTGRPLGTLRVTPKRPCGFD